MKNLEERTEIAIQASENAVRILREALPSLPITSIIVTGTYLTDEFTKKSDLDIHVVIPDRFLNKLNNLIKAALGNLAVQQSAHHNQEIHYWENPESFYFELQDFQNTPNESEFSLDGMKGGGANFVKLGIKKHGKTIKGKNIIPEIVVPEHYDPLEANRLFALLSNELIPGLIKKRHDKLGKAVLRAQNTFHIAETGEMLTTYQEMKNSPRPGYEDLLEKAYAAKIIAQQGLWGRVKYFFKNFRFAGSGLKKEEVLNYLLETKNIIEEKTGHHESLALKLRKQRTSFAVVENILEQEAEITPELLILFGDEFVTYLRKTDLERDDKVPLIRRRIVDFPKIRNALYKFSINQNKLIKKYPSLEETIKTTNTRILGELSPENVDRMFNNIREQGVVSGRIIDYEQAYSLVEREEYETALKIIDQYPEDLDMLILKLKTPLNTSTNFTLKGKQLIYDTSEQRKIAEKILSIDDQNVFAIIKLVNQMGVDVFGPVTHLLQGTNNPIIQTLLNENKSDRELEYELVSKAETISPNNPKIAFIKAKQATKSITVIPGTASITGMNPEMPTLCLRAIKQFEKYMNIPKSDHGLNSMIRIYMPEFHGDGTNIKYLPEWYSNWNNIRTTYLQTVDLFVTKAINEIEKKMSSRGFETQGNEYKQKKFNKEIFDLARTIGIQIEGVNWFESVKHHNISKNSLFEEKLEPFVTREQEQTIACCLEIMAKVGTLLDYNIAINYSIQAQKSWKAQKQQGPYLRAKFQEIMGRLLIRDSKFLDYANTYVEDLVSFFKDEKRAVPVYNLCLMHSATHKLPNKFEAYKEKLLNLTEPNEYTSEIIKLGEEQLRK